LIVAGRVRRPVRLIDRKIAGRIPMRTSTLFALALLVLLADASFSRSTRAADLSGAWASPDASVCSMVFVKNNDRMSFTPDADLYGGGFIVEGSLATGTFQKCTIKSMKNDGADIHLIASCSTGVMVSDVQFTVRIIRDNQIMVSMPPPENVETPYVRCPR
jgi:hypothetical protein